jgi:hypothetical protein
MHVLNNLYLTNPDVGFDDSSVFLKLQLVLEIDRVAENDRSGSKFDSTRPINSTAVDLIDLDGNDRPNRLAPHFR